MNQMVTILVYKYLTCDDVDNLITNIANKLTSICAWIWHQISFFMGLNLEILILMTA